MPIESHVNGAIPSTLAYGLVDHCSFGMSCVKLFIPEDASPIKSSMYSDGIFMIGMS